jgi:hypothetical protein
MTVAPRRALLALAAVALAASAGGAPAPGSAPDAPAADFKPLRAVVIPEAAPGLYSMQGSAPLDAPVGDAIRIGGLTVPAQAGEQGVLKLDLRASGSFSTYRSDQAVALTLQREGSTRAFQARLFLRKGPDGSWTYRNVTQLAVRVEDEQLVVVDANGNGLYNEPGVDAMGLRGGTYLFPLPGPEERWCTTKREVTGLSLGPWGEELKISGRPLATKHASALPVLQGVIEERLKIGLTPRPEDPGLSDELQKHCGYMSANDTLTHPEEKGKPGYTPEGHEAGMRSILSAGSPAERVAFGMVVTYFHRIDVTRPDTLLFGVGYAGRYGGIDGRAGMGKSPRQTLWPVLCPAPGQTDVPLVYGKEAPDATPGDPAAGYPVTVQFHTGKLKLTGHALRVATPGTPPGGTQKTGAPGIPCYPFDPETGASNGMTGFLRCVCVIPKDPLQSGTEYEVTIEADVEGKPWSRTWRFTTGSGGERRRR